MSVFKVRFASVDGRAPLVAASHSPFPGWAPSTYVFAGAIIVSLRFVSISKKGHGPRGVYIHLLDIMGYEAEMAKKYICRQLEYPTIASFFSACNNENIFSCAKIYPKARLKEHCSLNDRGESW